MRADGPSHLGLTDLHIYRVLTFILRVTQTGQERMSLHILRHLQAACLQQCRGDIHQAHQLSHPSARGKRPSGQRHGDMDGALMAGTLILFVACLEMASMVRGE